MVAKTLLFAIGTQYDTLRQDGAIASAEGSRVGRTGGAIDCGIVGTIYFRLRRNPPHVESLATDFANERLWRLLRKNWQRLKLLLAVLSRFVNAQSIVAARRRSRPRGV